MRNRILLTFSWAVVAGVVALPAAAQEEGEQTPTEVVAISAAEEGSSEGESQRQVTWLHDPARARELSVERNAPMLIVAGAEWCPPCQLLKEEIKNPAVQKLLEGWVPVHLDVDDHPGEATALGVSAMPTLIGMSPGGRVLSTREGLLQAAELAEWLEELQQVLQSGDTTEDWSPGQLSALDILKVLKSFRSREATVREAAISRLLESPELAAAPVVSQFIEAGLSERLACLELLIAWEAPVDGLDPWVPESITDERLQKLQQWVEARQFPDDLQAEQLSGVAGIEARRLIRRLKSATGAEAFSIREQLTRIGSAALPLLDEALAGDLDQQTQAALNQARYRIVSSDRLRSESSDDIRDLVSSNYDTRIDAVARIASSATVQDEALLMQLFKDPVPLVRELALKGLTRIRGADASGALVKLLDDQDPNVRVAVLQQLSLNPSPQLVPVIEQYMENETDPDLVVHAIRFLKEQPSRQSAMALLEVSNHPSWRVRAEAVEGINAVLDDYEHRELRSNEEIAKVLQERSEDEDGFVAQRAVKALVSMDVGGLKEELAASILDRPETAAGVIRAFEYHWQSIAGGEERVRGFATHERADIRAAAISVLVEFHRPEDGQLIADRLRDEDKSVRVATLEAVQTRLRRSASSAASLQTSGMMGEYSVTMDAGTVYSIEFDSEPGLLSGVLGALGRGLGFSGSDDAEAELIEIEGDAPPVVAAYEDGDEIGPPSIGDSGDWEQQLDALVKQHQVDQLRADFRQKLSESEPTATYQPALRELFESGDQSEQLNAAVCLVSFGDTEAWEAVLKAAEVRKNISALSLLLSQLTIDETTQLFQKLIETSSATTEYTSVLSAASYSPDVRISSLIWDFFAGDVVEGEPQAEWIELLQTAHFQQHHYNISQASEEEQQYLTSRTNHMLQEGNDLQRWLAFLLLAEVAEEQAQNVALQLKDDETIPGGLKRDAIQVLLCTLPEESAKSLVDEIINSGDQELQELAVLYAAFGKEALSYLRGSVMLSSAYGTTWTMGDSPQIIRPEVPFEDELPDLSSLLNSDTIQVRVAALFLNAMQGDKAALEQLIREYQRDTDEESLMRLVWRAIAAHHATEHVDVLAGIYRQLDDPHALSEFYWTIRIMSGPDVMALRKKIRSETNKNDLRWVQRESSGGGFGSW